MDISPSSLFGYAGEEEAARYMVAQGYLILDRNYRCRYGEVDLVVRNGDTIVFVEVKTRSTDRFGLPVEAVRGPKQVRLRRTAAVWLDEKRPGRCNIRFDVVSVILRGRKWEVTHYPEAF